MEAFTREWQSRAPGKSIAMEQMIQERVEAGHTAHIFGPEGIRTRVKAEFEVVKSETKEREVIE